MSRSNRGMWWFACVSALVACAESPAGGANRSQDEALVVRSGRAGAVSAVGNAGALQTGAVGSIAARNTHVFDEDDARLLLALSLKHLCSLVSGCSSWLGSALQAEYGGGTVQFSAAVDERIAARVAQLSSLGDFARATAVQESYRSLAEDLRAVSSIGLDGPSMQAVVDGLLPKPIVLKTDKLTLSGPAPLAASLASATAAKPFPASSLGERADAYVLELFAAAAGKSLAEIQATACVVGPVPGLPATPFTKGGPVGSATCGLGAGVLDSALDPSCDDLAPFPDPWYCSTAEAYNEYGSSQPHLLQVGFAVSARRCEPCQDGSATGTLVPLRRWDGSSITVCDTSAACRGEAPDIAACPCLSTP